MSASTFPRLFGGANGAPNFTAFTNAQVGAYFRTLYADISKRLETEVMDTVLDVYASTLSLGGRTGLAYGFAVTALGLGASNWNIDQSGQAFGVANSTVLTVFQILLAANKNAVGGTPWASSMVLQNQGLSVFNHPRRIFCRQSAQHTKAIYRVCGRLSKEC